MYLTQCELYVHGNISFTTGPIALPRCVFISVRLIMNSFFLFGLTGKCELDNVRAKLYCVCLIKHHAMKTDGRVEYSSIIRPRHKVNVSSKLHASAALPLQKEPTVSTG
jgi:hypothetical protein